MFPESSLKKSEKILDFTAKDTIDSKDENYILDSFITIYNIDKIF
jgi:hypothetical protein